MASPFWAAVRILPRATWLSAMSTTIGGWPRCGAANAIGLVPKSGCLPPQGAIALGVLPNASATQAGLRQPLHVVPGNAEMMRAREAGGGNAVRPGHLRQPCDRKIERRKGEAVPGIDHQAAGPRLVRFGHGMAVDLAGFGLRRVARHAREAMPLLAVDLGLRQCARATDSRVRRRSYCTPRAPPRSAPPARLGLWMCRAHRPFFSTRATLSTVMKLTRWLASRVTPEICGVRITLGMPANTLPASALIGS